MTDSAQPKIRFATAWLDGCSGCHMSFLDIDEKLIEIAEKIEVVYSPIVDIKVFPENVDVTLVEGAISTAEDLEIIKLIRERTNLLVALGDCAVTGNVPALRNPFGTDKVMQQVYQSKAKIPHEVVPMLLRNVRPIHHVVKVDVYVPGCPPSAKTIAYVLDELLAGRKPELGERTRFGA
ncbi:MAG TPA: hypothetical protein VMT34_12500 [Aggregatilineales bacterium]|nr:hypothetical protein [Aggregatilineales bacterium]